MCAKLLPKAPNFVDVAAVEKFGSQSEPDLPVLVDNFGQIRRFVGTEFDAAFSYGFGICKLIDDLGLAGARVKPTFRRGAPSYGGVDCIWGVFGNRYVASTAFESAT